MTHMSEEPIAAGERNSSAESLISPETKNHLINVLLLFLLQAGDSVTTKIILSRGGQEMNSFLDPSIRAAFEQAGMNSDLLTGKLPYLIGLIGASVAARIFLSKREGMWSLRLVNLATAAVVLNNAWGIFQQSYPK